MDELARVELGKLQEDWDSAMDGIQDGQFKAKQQLVYVREMDVRIAKADGRPWIAFTVCGAEPDNAKCEGDVLFGLRQAPPKDKKWDIECLGKFLVALGLPRKPDLKNLDQVVQPILNKIFAARVDIRKGKAGQEFLNVTPQGFKGAEATKPESGDMPF